MINKIEKNQRKLNMLAEVATLYYIKDKKQSQIAKQMFISRSQVSRYLKEAKEKGLVKIRVGLTSDNYYNMH